LSTEEKVERVWTQVTVGYADVDGLQRLAEDLEIVVEVEDYGAEVRYELGVPVPALQSLRQRVADLTRGTGRVVTRVDEVTRDRPEGD